MRGHLQVTITGPRTPLCTAGRHVVVIRATSSSTASNIVYCNLRRCRK
jgi:hypothetical protein